MWLIADVNDFYGCFRKKEEAVWETQCLSDSNQRPKREEKGCYVLNDFYIFHHKFLLNEGESLGFKWVLEEAEKNFVKAIVYLWLLNEFRHNLKLAYSKRGVNTPAWQCWDLTDKIQGFLPEVTIK